MDDSTMTTRRRLLEGASVGGGALLAGCTDQFDLGSGGSGTGTDAAQTDAGDTTVDGVGAVATIDQEAFRQEQASIREELQAGNITQEEAREQAVELEEEYLSEAVSALAATVEETDGVEVVDEYSSLGAVVLSGEAVTIIGLLDSDDVNVLVSQSDIEDRAETATATESA